jgi:hypothetical protein
MYWAGICKSKCMNHSVLFKCFEKLVSTNKQFWDSYALKSCLIQALWFLRWLRTSNHRCCTCSGRELRALDIPHCFYCVTQIYEELDARKPSLRMLYVTPELIGTGGIIVKLQKIHGRGLLALIPINEVCLYTNFCFSFLHNVIIQNSEFQKQLRSQTITCKKLKYVNFFESYFFRTNMSAWNIYTVLVEIWMFDHSKANRVGFQVHLIMLVFLVV